MAIERLTAVFETFPDVRCFGPCPRRQILTPSVLTINLVLDTSLSEMPAMSVRTFLWNIYWRRRRIGGGFGDSLAGTLITGPGATALANLGVQIIGPVKVGITTAAGVRRLIEGVSLWGDATSTLLGMVGIDGEGSLEVRSIPQPAVEKALGLRFLCLSSDALAI